MQRLLALFILMGVNLLTAHSSYQYRDAKQAFAELNVKSIELWSIAEKYTSLILTTPGDAAKYVDSLRSENNSNEIDILYTYWLSKALSGISQYDSALKLLRTITFNKNIPILMGDIFVLKGRLHSVKGQIDSTFIYLTRAEEIFIDSKDPIGIAITYINQAEVHRSISDYQKGLGFLSQVVSMNGFNQFPINLQFYFWGRRAAIYNEIGDLDESIKSLNQIISSTQKNQYPFILAESLNELGLIAEKQGNFDQALRHYIKAYRIWKDGDNPRYWTNVITHIARLSIRDKRYERAEEWINKGLMTAINHEWHGILYIYYDLLAIVAFEQSKHELVFDYKSKAASHQKMDFNIRMNKELSILQAETEANRKQLQLEVEKSKVVALKSKNQAILLSGMLVSIVCLLILALYLREKRNRKRFITINHQLRLALQHNQSMLKDVHHRVKNNLAMLTGLIHHESKSAPIEAKEIFERMRERLEAIAVVHSRLMDYSKTAITNMVEVIEDLRNLILLNSDIQLEVEFTKNKEFSGLEPNKAILLGIVLNELLTNSVKHAFNKKGKNIIFLAYEDQNDQVIVKYNDQSSGILEHKNKYGAGAKLIDMMMNQLKGTLSHQSDNHWITLVIPK